MRLNSVEYIDFFFSEQRDYLSFLLADWFSVAKSQVICTQLKGKDGGLKPHTGERKPP